MTDGSLGTIDFSGSLMIESMLGRPSAIAKNALYSWPKGGPCRSGKYFQIELWLETVSLLHSHMIERPRARGVDDIVCNGGAIEDIWFKPDKRRQLCRHVMLNRPLHPVFDVYLQAEDGDEPGLHGIEDTRYAGVVFQSVGGGHESNVRRNLVAVDLPGEEQLHTGRLHALGSLSQVVDKERQGRLRLNKFSQISIRKEVGAKTVFTRKRQALVVCGIANDGVRNDKLCLGLLGCFLQDVGLSKAGFALDQRRPVVGNRNGRDTQITRLVSCEDFLNDEKR